MAKTSKQIQTDIYRLIKDSILSLEISGDIYRNGYRPRDSRKEDAVVIFTAGLPDEIQTGVVTINIYVPDIDPYDNGVFVENGERTELIERLAQQWVDSLTADVSSYLFQLKQTIYTMEEPSINQHFVVIHLSYKYYGLTDDDPLNIPNDAVIDGYDINGDIGYEPYLATEDDDLLTINLYDE